MSKTAVSVGTISVPYEDGGSSGAFNLAFNFLYTQKENCDRNYAAPVTNDPISFGSIMGGAGAKLVLIKCISGSATITFNGITAFVVPMGAGSMFIHYNPTAGFIESMSITTAGAAVLEILAVA